MPATGVIFDVDGVLVDSYDAHFESWRDMYAEIGRPYDEAAFAADFGRTSRDILRRTLGSELTDNRIAELDHLKESLFREIMRDKFVAMDGAVELIDALHRDGFLLAVGSSGPPENIALVLEKLGRADKISAVITGADVSRGKPDPQVFQLAAQGLGLPASACAVVEDAVHGIEAANRAGTVSIGLTGTNTAKALSSATLVVERLRELSPERIRNLILSKTS